MSNQKPIERTFPISEVNRIAEREAHAKRYYRPVYTMHKWWARRLGSVFRTIALYALTDEEALERAEAEVGADLLTFEKSTEERIWDLYLKDAQVGKGKVVLDPMMGGGTSIVEALRLGANVIGCDLNPVAWFVVKKEIEPVNLEALDGAFEHLKEAIAPEILKYYKTTCPVCGEEADAMYYFWVKELGCTNCGQPVPLFKDYRVASSRSVRVEHHPHVECAECGADFSPTEEEPHCPECGWEFDKSGFYHLLCPLCGGMFEAKNYRAGHRCPHCGHVSQATEGNASGQYYTCPRPDCWQKYKIVDGIAQLGKPPERLYGVEYYCPHCDLKGYKAADEDDRALYRAAARELAQIGDTLPLPDQEVPPGQKTRELLNHGYHNFRDMFNARQLLCLGRLLEETLEIADENVKEVILLTFSTFLDYSNMFCLYNRAANKVEHLFLHHAFYPQNAPVENNVWGTKYGRGTFVNEFEMVRQGKEYGATPFEKYLDGDKLKEQHGFSALNGKLVASFDDLGQEGNALLLCRSSDFLPLPDQCVDLVLTDPPYYDNVMYSELSDFFYVWLRLALKERYPHFRAALTPKAEEAVKNSAQGKDEADFLRILTDIFRECHRTLKPDGLMTFTYHHKQDEAWSAVLKALLDAGFYITAAWPIHSEMSTSTHIYDKQNISYDTIIVARRRDGEGERISWYRLAQQIHDRAAEIVEYYRRHDGRYLSEPDMGVVAQAKCLELYAQHYPNVMEEGQMVAVKEAVKRTSGIVTEQLIEERFQALVGQSDTLTALYLLFLAGRDSITYDALNKLLRGRGADVEDFTGRNLLRSEGGRLHVVHPVARRDNINARDPELAIDGAHYMIYVRQERDLMAEAAPFARREIIFTLEELAKIKRDEGYQEIAEYLKRMQYTR